MLELAKIRIYLVLFLIIQSVPIVMHGIGYKREYLAGITFVCSLFIAIEINKQWKGKVRDERN